MGNTDHDIDLGDADAVGRLVARARRVADLSQRDLATRVGVSPATVARLESGAGLPRLPLLAAILRAAGLRLRVIAGDEAPVAPIPATTVRDNAGRRFPAHLDVAPPDEVPAWAREAPRYDRPKPPAWHHRRAERDRISALKPAAGRQVDHPTQEQLEERERLRRGPQPIVSPTPVEIVCTCPDACFDDDEVIGCLPECPCQCEPPCPEAIVLTPLF
jgi:HTH-type transcriptional regulator/antitoxin HipB